MPWTPPSFSCPVPAQRLVQSGYYERGRDTRLSTSGGPASKSSASSHRQRLRKVVNVCLPASKAHVYGVLTGCWAKGSVSLLRIPHSMKPMLLLSSLKRRHLASANPPALVCL